MKGMESSQEPQGLWEALGKVCKHPERLENVPLPSSPHCVGHSMQPIKASGLFLHLCPKEGICGSKICLF